MARRDGDNPKARAALLAAAALLEGHLGPAREQGPALAFGPPPGACSLELSMRLTGKFLGGVHSLVLAMRLPAPGLRLEGPLRLRYAGLLAKGKASLEARGQAGQALAAQLNADPELPALLGAQDLEEMEIVPQEDGLLARFVPVGGGYVYAMVPPVGYHVRLPADQARAMALAAVRLARLVAQYIDRQGASPAAEEATC